MRLFAFAVLWTVLPLCSTAQNAADPSAVALRLYEGVWQVTPSGGTKASVLENQCSTISRYFACAQSVNGAPGNLIIFMPAGKPGHYYTQTILPEGRATGRDDLEISGNTWTYTSRRDQNGQTTFYRTTNTFTDKNHIHYEQAQSTDNKRWTVGNSGDETRSKPLKR